MSACNKADPTAGVLREGLVRRWLSLCRRLGLSGEVSAAGEIVMCRYAEPHRHYHNLSHVAECLGLLDEHGSGADDPEAVEMAMWFHDVIYDIRSSDNEARSALFAGDALRSLYLSPEKIKVIESLILATGHQTSSELADERLVCDIDLSILGQPESVYDAYALAILEETGLSEDDFARPRSDFLQHMLLKETIFHTNPFRVLFETQARANLRRELERLRPGNSEPSRQSR